MSDLDSAQQEFWDRRAEVWDRRVDFLSSFSDTYGRAAMDALGVEAGERVLDIGCGPGSTAIQLAARVGSRGEVVGVDISPAMVAAATRRAAGAGVDGVRFVAADAQTGDIGSGYDAAFSRFGVMFFTDPGAAFANIAAALRAGGRVGFVVWAPVTDNPWMLVPTMAAASVLQAELTLPGPGEPGPFSLSDPARVIALLRAAGFVDIAVERIEGARLVDTAQVDDEIKALLEVGPFGDAFTAADDTTRDAAVAAVLGAIEPYRHDQGWRLPGAALVAVARRP